MPPRRGISVGRDFERHGRSCLPPSIELELESVKGPGGEPPCGSASSTSRARNSERESWGYRRYSDPDLAPEPARKSPPGEPNGLRG